MRRAVLSMAILASLSANAVLAQDFDDRWYAAPRIGAAIQDSSRDTDDDLYWGLGFGRYLAPNWALDFEMGWNHNPTDGPAPGRWENFSAGLAARYFFGDSEKRFQPYIMGGAGFIYDDTWFSKSQVSPMVNVGAGLRYELSARTDLRAELAYRHDFNNPDLLGESNFGDWLATVGLAIALGPDPQRAEPEVEPEVQEPVKQTPPPADSDRDGVTDDRDACPDSVAGQMIGPDGCPVDVAIDLRGVNFEFDKSVLLPESMATLNEAVSILKRYDTLRIEVAGHTDSKGSDEYNQRLSERRAKVVFDYLVDNGIAADRLSSAGYGESRPIDTNDTDEGRARNRRTELVILK